MGNIIIDGKLGCASHEGNIPGQPVGDTNGVDELESVVKMDSADNLDCVNKPDAVDKLDGVDEPGCVVSGLGPRPVDEPDQE